MNRTAVEQAKRLLQHDPDVKQAVQTAKDLNKTRADAKSVINDFANFFLYTYCKLSGKMEFVNDRYSVRQDWYEILCCYLDPKKRRRKKREKVFLCFERSSDLFGYGYIEIYNPKYRGYKWSEMLVELIEDLKYDLNKHIYKRRNEISKTQKQIVSIKAALP